MVAIRWTGKRRKALFQPILLNTEMQVFSTRAAPFSGQSAASAWLFFAQFSAYAPVSAQSAAASFSPLSEFDPPAWSRSR
jgi:hypothetical protein